MVMLETNALAGWTISQFLMVFYSTLVKSTVKEQINTLMHWSGFVKQYLLHSTFPAEKNL